MTIPELAGQARPDVAVILLTKNSQLYLREILTAIFAQDTRHRFEVIAVDSGSQDDSLAILACYPVRVCQIPPQDFNHGETRNYGARQASASVRYLVYLTHDATPTPGWMERLIAAVEESPQVAGAHSRHLPRPTCPLPQARLLQEEWEQSGTPRRIVKRFTTPEDYERRRLYYAWFSNTSSCIRKEIWEQYPFGRVDFAEDAHWADRVLRAGYTLIYEPASTVIHSHDYGLWDQFAQSLDHARGMKRIFPAPAEAQTPRVAARTASFVRAVTRDCRYVLRRGLSPWATLYWLAYSPCWHVASFLGTRAGRHYDRLPAWLIRRLSRQERLRRMGAPKA